MIIGFKKQFVTKICVGIKIHTIREDSHGRWKDGRLIHFATGVRTKNYNCFKKGICYNVQDIKILHFNGKQYTKNVFIDGKIKYVEREHVNSGNEFIEQLAKNDGFDSVDDFFRWFNKDFEGKIIQWTDFRY